MAYMQGIINKPDGLPRRILYEFFAVVVLVIAHCMVVAYTDPLRSTDKLVLILVVRWVLGGDNLRKHVIRMA